MDRSQSSKDFAEARSCIPGGVNSPVRAFANVNATPVFYDHAKGSHVWDVDGNEYIDFIGSWGPMILGHCPDVVEAAVRAQLDRGMSYGAPCEAEITMAEEICRLVPAAEKARMVSSGTEATMSAIRLARGYTHRDKFIKFEGNYHGHSDALLVAAGSGVATFGIPGTPGVTAGAGILFVNLMNFLIEPVAELPSLLAERGEEYLCGENGSGLSGGEKQRISIARSLLKQSSVLLADEATAALDAETAHRVSAELLDLSEMTRIVVTHSLEEVLLRRCDGILVLKDGRLAEMGRFDELMENKGYFYALYTVSQ